MIAAEEVEVKVAIVGGGLVGGSLGAALRGAGGYRVRCLDRAERIAAIERAGIFEDVRAFEDGAAFLAEADVVVLAATAAANAELIAQVGARARDGAIVTDVGGAKVAIAELARARLRPGVSFVGGHPMAGDERGGIGAADPLLFAGRPYCLCPTPETGEGALLAVLGMVEAVGAVPLLLDAEEHDRIVARMSHLPQLVATALAASIGDAAVDPRMVAAVAGRGFADMTRLAASDLAMWRGILSDNAVHVVEAMDAFGEALAALREGVLSGADLEEIWGRARRERHRIAHRSSRGSNLGGIRNAIDELDRELLEMVAKRNALARRAGEAKRRAGRPVADLSREGRLRRKWQTLGSALGLSPAATDALRELLVGEARRVQEAARLSNGA